MPKFGISARSPLGFTNERACEKRFKYPFFLERSHYLKNQIFSAYRLKTHSLHQKELKRLEKQVQYLTIQKTSLVKLKKLKYKIVFFD